jgi:hypothetical protein
MANTCLKGADGLILLAEMQEDLPFGIVGIAIWTVEQMLIATRDICLSKRNQERD